MQTVVTELSPMGWLVAAQFLLYAAGWAVFALVLRENRSAFWQWGACMLLMGLGILLASQRGEPRAWAPVSYTHLDVYKRQMPSLPSRSYNDAW